VKFLFESLLPNLSISSIKIVAIVLIEIGAIRRDLGQLILATPTLDDRAARSVFGGALATSVWRNDVRQSH